ncbi:MAG: oxidoreductase [Gammaproteobacteria bacterium]|nr:oxidoreductase [Gammaproteobacteria bacterium]
MSVPVALIGYGYAGKTFHAPLIEACPELALQLVVSSDAAKVHADLPHVQVVASVDQALNDGQIALVVIASPNDSHFPIAQAALRAGKAVVVDKPFTLTLAEAEALVALAAERGLLLSVFHNRRWDSDFLTLCQLLATGRLGPLHRIQSRFDRYRPEVRQRWREQAGAGSGLWFDLAPHLLDQALLLFGPPARLWADIRTVRAGAETDDEFLAILDYGLLRVEIGASMLCPQPAPRWQVTAATGDYRKQLTDPQEGRLKAGERPSGARWGSDEDAGLLTLIDGDAPLYQSLAQLPGSYPAYYAAVAAALTKGGANPVSGAEALAVMQWLELGYRSARDGRWVTAADLGRT